MKRILFVAVSATLLAAGCQKTKIINQINPTGEPSMTFTTSMGKLTKASGGQSDAEGDGMANLQAQDFRVWVYGAENFSHTQENDMIGYDKMLNLPVTYSAAGWGTAKQHFWPGQKKELKFFAVSADKEFMGEETGPGSVSPVSPDAESKTLTVNGFVSTNADYNTDLMVADFVQQDQTNKTVDLWFRHALSKVQFAFNTVIADGINVFVQKVEVKGLKTSGNLAVSFDEANKNHTVFQWTLDAEATADFIDDWETPVSEGMGFPEKIEGSSDISDEDKKSMKITSIKDTDAQPNVFTTWLVLPQEVEDKKVEITYLMNERQFLAEFNLAYEALRQTTEKAMWNDNQFIRYVVTLAPNLISFNPQVGEWDDPENLETQN